jgi:hypothetical protein
MPISDLPIVNRTAVATAPTAPRSPCGHSRFPRRSARFARHGLFGTIKHRNNSVRALPAHSPVRGPYLGPQDATTASEAGVKKDASQIDSFVLWASSQSMNWPGPALGSHDARCRAGCVKPCRPASLSSAIAVGRSGRVPASPAFRAHKYRGPFWVRQIRLRQRRE